MAFPVLPSIIPVNLLLFLAAMEAGVHFWYRVPASVAPPSHLVISWPAHETDFHAIPISDASRRLLLFNTGAGAGWRDSSGREWCLYHFTWDPGRTSTQSARIHRPENCLQAAGAILVRDRGSRQVAIPGGVLGVREYEFHKDNKPLYVLFSLHEQYPADRDPAAMLQDWSGWSRIQRALAGTRNLGQETLEIGMCPSFSDPDPLDVMTARVPALASLSTVRK
jgi:hypothetical protein